MKYLYQYAVLPVFDEANPRPGDFVELTEQDGKHYVLSGTERQDADLLVGAWHNDGTLADGVTIDPVYWEVWPLANRDGTATDDLRAGGWQGHGFPLAQAPETALGDPKYPADSQPWQLEVRHDENAFGHGIRCEMPHWAMDPGTRDVAIYADAAHSQYLYVLGGFSIQASAWQLDDQGQPYQVYACETPPGQRQPARQDWHFALWDGQAVAVASLLSSQNSYFGNFWSTGQGSQWVDSGATVTGMAGTATLVSDYLAFLVGDLTRINGTEQQVTQVNAAGWIVQTPYFNHSGNIGTMIEVWR